MRAPSSRSLAIATAALAAFVRPPLDAAAPPIDLTAAKRGEIVSGISALSDPTQTYELYLPAAFTPDRRWPVLVLFDPRSRGKVAAELFRPAAEELGWILISSNNTRSDEPGDANQRAVDALFPEALTRLPIDERRIYAGGFSGGAVLAWSVGLVSRRLAGVISIGGRPEPAHAALAPNFPLFAAAGVEDFNYQPTRALVEIAAKAGVGRRLEFYPGPHAWCPPETARRALVWLETLAMRDGLVPRDEARAARFLAADLERAAALEKAGDLLGAVRLLEVISASFRGLVEIAAADSAALRAGRLLDSQAAKGSVKEEESAERYEGQGSRRIGDALVLLRADPVPAVARLRQVLGLADARKRVAVGGAAGAAARRYLEAIAVHLGFYGPRSLMAAGNYRAALPGLEVAAETKPDDPFLRYNLACAKARTGDAGGAVAALELALDLGLTQPEQMATDPDLESLSERPDFRALVERARAATAPRTE